MLIFVLFFSPLKCRINFFFFFIWVVNSVKYTFFVQRGMKKTTARTTTTTTTTKHAVIFDLLHNRILDFTRVGVLIFLSLSLSLVLWHKLIKSSWTLCCVFQFRTAGKGNQHGGREFDDLQNWLDMASRENPLYWNITFVLKKQHWRNLIILKCFTWRWLHLYLTWKNQR